MLEQIKRAGELYARGMSTRDLAPLLGVSKSTAARYVSESGVPVDKRAMISRKAIGRPSARKGATLTAETKAKLSAARKGKSYSIGQKRTDEQRERMRQAARKLMADPVFREKRMASMRLGLQARKLPAAEVARRNKLRAKARQMLRRLLTMPRTHGASTIEAALGYTKQDLVCHLEKQFRPGMSWSDRASFHIDHIVPFDQFFRDGVSDMAVINALSNLQILTPAENRAKHTKVGLA